MQNDTSRIEDVFGVFNLFPYDKKYFQTGPIKTLSLPTNRRYAFAILLFINRVNLSR